MEGQRRESEPYGRFLVAASVIAGRAAAARGDAAHVDAALAALAGAQHAVVALDQLRELGLTARAVQKRAAAGRLHRIHRGVYSLVPRELLTRHGHWMAAVLACGPGAVLSHCTAAALLGLRPTQRAKIDVTVPTAGGRCHHPMIDIHRSTVLTPVDITTVQNIPCTAVARTQLDLAEVVDRRAMERAFDRAEALEVFDLRAIEDQLARNPNHRGGQAVRSVLKEHFIGETMTWNQFEERFLELCADAALPRPEVNKWLLLPDGGPAIRPDFMWRQQHVLVETDGKQTHGTRQSFESDRDRDQRTLVAGWRTMRVTRRQLNRRPRTVETRLRALLKE